MDSYVATLDIGTTTVRCHIVNRQAETIGKASCNVNLLYPKPGYVEIDPDELWNNILDVVKRSIQDANLHPKDIKCMGISTQRATFINWRKDNGKHLHNFITWKDLRANDMVKDLNSSLSIKAVKYAAFSVYILTRSNRFLTGSRLKLASNHITVRLLWAIANIPELKQAIAEDNVRFGTVETWLIHKLTGGKTYVADISNASATGFYDPFVLDWGFWAIQILKVPANILPPVVDNDHEFGNTECHIFGAEIPIKCILSDQSSATFGLGCLKQGDLKLTLGTGGFLNVISCNKIHSSANGMYPLVGWKLNGQVVYMSEVPCNDVGSLIQWALNVGLFERPADIESIVKTVSNTDGVFFIPAFSGMGAPIFDEKTASGFIGIKPTTRKEHLVRALMESIVFRIAQSFIMLKKEIPDKYPKIRIDGGVSNSNFVCQMLADVINVKIERLSTVEMSSMGVAFAAGLKAGVWESMAEIDKLRKIENLFQPSTDDVYRDKLCKKMRQWVKAADRLRSWYEDMEDLDC